MKYALILSALLYLAYQGKEQTPDRLEAASCYINATADGTDTGINNAIIRAAQLYSLSPDEVERLAAWYYN